VNDIELLSQKFAAQVIDPRGVENRHLEVVAML
jgi:hypothetical protein